MIVYRTHSFIQTLLTFLIQIAYIVISAIALYHFKENPIVTTIVAIICVFFLLISGNDEVIVYSNTLEFKPGSLIRILRKKEQFNIDDIKSIVVRGTFGTGDEISGPKTDKRKSLNEIEISFKNGKSVFFRTSIYIEKLNNATREIERLIKK